MYASEKNVVFEIADSKYMQPSPESSDDEIKVSQQLFEMKVIE